MTPLLSLKRYTAKLLRIRNRRGYGVHSPFAFHFITMVIYENTPYYKYKELKARQRAMAPLKERQWAQRESTKTKQLLFRLINNLQPRTILHMGPPSAATLYLQAPKADIDYTFAATPDELFLERGVPVDFLYLHHHAGPEQVKKTFALCVDRIGPQSAFVVEGIGHTPAMKKLWQEMKQHSQVRVTFDLFDLGILFFDPAKNKQHYLVNF